MKITTLAAVLLLVLATPVTHAADVKANWDKHCFKCHGADGKGGTKLGKQSGVKDLTDPKVQAAFTDEKAFKSTKEGIKDGERTKMKPAENLSDEEIKALVVFVRALKT